MPNNKIQSLTVNGVTYDIVDNTSGYINAQYIENKTDYSIPVSRVGEIVVGETAIGTDSTNFPTSKAVVDYVDERVVQEIDAIDVGVISVNGKTGSVTLSASDIGAATTSQIPTSTSQLTNDSGFITSDSDEKLAVSRNLDNGLIYEVVLGSSTDPINTETKFQSKTFQYTLFNNTASLSIGNNSARGELRLYGPQSSYSTRIRSTAIASNYTIHLPNKEGTIALTSDIPTVPTKVSDLTNDSGFISSYTETDPVFSASPAAGISATDISNWNAKVSDDKTWNGVTLNNTTLSGSTIYIPARSSATNTNAYNITASITPISSTIGVAMYNSSGYLNSTTPSANDNSTKVATTAYVDAAIPKVYSSTNTGGYLTMATLPIYDGTVV